jgi:hypothetical protein
MKLLFIDPVNRTLAKIAILCVGCAAAALAQHNQDDLKQRILSQAQSVSPDDYSFTRTIRSEQTSAGKTEKKVTVEKFDPAKSAEARWTLVSVDGAPPSADALNDFRKDAGKRRVPGYHRLANWFGTPAKATADSSGQTVFHFADLPKDTLKVMETDVSPGTTADAMAFESNGTPFVGQVRLTVKAMRLKLIMKLDKFESTSRYRLGPEGKPLLMEQVSDMTGSGMGKEGRVHTVTLYSDYRVVRR